MKKKPKNPLINILSDSTLPEEDRRKMLVESIMEDSTFAGEILMGLQSANAQSVYEEKNEHLSAILKDLESGPFRPATFVSLDTPNGSQASHAHVILDDGTEAFSVAPDEKIAQSLRKGDQVLLDGRGKMVIRKAPDRLKIGSEAIFERVVDGRYVEVSTHNQERYVFLPTQDLEDGINSGEISPGDTFVVNTRQSIAFNALPSEDSHSHYKYLSNQAVPDVIAQRDIGSPPAVIDRLSRFVRLEMTEPELRRRFGLRRSSMNLLTGIPGTGKTLAIEAVWRDMYEIMSEVTGVPVEQLPPRVLKLKMSEILSEWLGRADKNFDRFFDEVEQLAAEKWEAPDGKKYELPVLVILEEIDGIARTRGQEAIYDRILTGVLQRLDPNRASLKDKLIIFIGTTNEPQMVDIAFSRRIGATVEKFSGLGRGGFSKVLKKQIAGLPVDHNGGSDAVNALVSDLTAWLFSPNGSDEGIIEITYVAGNAVDLRYRRDFLTGALLDRSVQQAAEKAAHDAAAGLNGSGIHLEHFVEALDTQIRNTTDQLSEHNVHKFLDLPDAVRVASVRRLAQPTLFPLQLQSH